MSELNAVNSERVVSVSKETVPRVAGDDDNDDFLSVDVLRRQYMDYLSSKVDEIEEQKNARRYYHGSHWTAEQLRILRDRHQPPTTWNRIARKINGIVGLVERLRSDPKADPTNPSSEQGADIATHVIRNVFDANAWKIIEPWCLLQCAIDGLAGVQLVLTTGDKGDPDISLPWVVGDEYFYDPISYRLDFGERKYDGISKWFSLDTAIELFPHREEILKGLVAGSTDLTTNPDREIKWTINATQRVRIVEHWYKHRGKWRWAFYVANTLLDQGISPFFDDKGNSIDSFLMFRVAVDQDGDTYGFVRNLMGPQDALNQAKSKTLHIANSRRLILEDGAVPDVEIARREWARPDGVVVTNPGKQIRPDDSRADLAAFASFTEDAKAELDSFANINVATMNGGPIGQLSGRAIELLRQPGMAELGPFILSIRGWKIAVFRGVWNTAQRYWTAERWLRVTDDQGVKQFLQVNGLTLDPWGRPALVNALGAVDVNISFDEGRDVASLLEDSYDLVKGDPTVPIAVKIELSPLPRSDKNRILQMLTPKPPQPNPLAVENMRLDLEGKAIRNAKGAAEVRKTHATAEQAFASADEKHAKAGAAAHGVHLDTAEFSRDSLFEAQKLFRQFQQPQPQGPVTP